VTLIDVLGTMIMVPLLPYVGEHYGANGLTVGLILTTSAVASTIAAPIWGSFSDRLGRKRIVLISQAVALGGYIGLAMSTSLTMLFVARAIAGIGGGGIGVTQSLIADVTGKDDRDRAYALFGAIFGLGIVLGPVIGGSLIRYGLAIPFVAAAAIELGTIVLTVVLLPSPHPHDQRGRNDLREAAMTVIGEPEVRSIVVRHLLFIFSVTYFFTIFALYLQRVLRIGPEVASGLLAGAGAIGGLSLLLIVVPLSRRFGDAIVAQFGLTLCVLAYAALAYARQLWIFGAALGVWAIGAACVEPTLIALLSNKAPEDERGAIMGFNDSANNVALIIAPALGGFAIDLDPHLVGIIPAFVAFLALAIGFARRRAEG
jgi:MFS transporter, DHA1 family, tetracycline resistance protein